MDKMAESEFDSAVLTLSNNWEDVSFSLPTVMQCEADLDEGLKIGECHDVMLTSSSKDSRIISSSRKKRYKMRIRSSTIMEESENSSEHSGDDFAAEESLKKVQASIGKASLKLKRKKYQESRNRYKKQLKATKSVVSKFIKSIKFLVPGVDGNCDKAGALEMALKYTQFSQASLGTDFREEFLASLKHL